MPAANWPRRTPATGGRSGKPGGARGERASDLGHDALPRAAQLLSLGRAVEIEALDRGPFAHVRQEGGHDLARHLLLQLGLLLLEAGLTSRFSSTRMTCQPNWLFTGALE